MQVLNMIKYVCFCIFCFLLYSITIEGVVLFLNCIKKLGAPCGAPSNDMFLILQLQLVSVLNELTHSPNGAYVQVVVKNHNVGILATLQ